jgi:hypothetical protein
MAKYLQNSADIEINEVGDNLQFEVVKEYFESGSNTNGYWVKYSDGTMICSATKKTTSIGVVNASGNLYISTVFQPFNNFPQTFTSLTSCDIFLVSQDVTSSPVWITKNNSTGPSTTNAGNCILMSPVSISSFTNYGYTLGYIAIGRWKE